MANTVFTLNSQSSVPIYRQIIEQIELKVATGELQVGDSVPSVREIATTLAVNPMTVSKAFSSLETKGILERQRGRPMKIAEGAVALSPSSDPADILKQELDALKRKADNFQLNPQQVIAAVKSILE